MGSHIGPKILQAVFHSPLVGLSVDPRQENVLSSAVWEGRGCGPDSAESRDLAETGICGVDAGRIWRGEQGWVSPRAGEVRLDMYVEQDVHTQV